MEQVGLIKTNNTGLQLASGILSGKISLPRLEMNLTIQQTLSKPLVRSVFKGENSELGFTFVTGLVKRFTDSFGFSSKLDESQIEIITVDTLERFSYESIEDIILFFKMARSGRLGVTNRGIDSNLIFGEWFPKYMELKVEAREKAYEKEKSEMVSTQTSMEDVMLSYSKSLSHNYKKQVSDYVDRITKNFSRQQLEDLIEQWNQDEKKRAYIDILKRKRREIKS